MVIYRKILNLVHSYSPNNECMIIASVLGKSFNRCLQNGKVKLHSAINYFISLPPL